MCKSHVRAISHVITKNFDSIVGSHMHFSNTSGIRNVMQDLCACDRHAWMEINTDGGVRAYSVRHVNVRVVSRVLAI
jgi:hypothetical protein